MGKRRAIELRFPIGGVHKRRSYQHQAEWTAPDALNFWPDDTYEERERGGSRWGMQKAFATQLGSGTPVELVYDVNYLNSGAYDNQLIAAAAGTLYYNNAGTLTAASGGITLDTDRQLCAADHLQKVYISSDNNAAKRLVQYTPSTNTAALVSGNETGGTVPDKCQIVVTYQDCIWLAGDLDDPHQWHKSKQGDALNWDTTDSTVARATSGTNAEAGKLGEPITALIPHHDDCMLMSGTTSIYVLRGNVNRGGQIKRLSDRVGVLSQQAWCHDAEGWLWMLTHDGIYAMAPGCGSTPISVSREKLPKQLRNIDTAGGTWFVSLEYDLNLRGVHIFVTKAVAGSTTHYFMDTFTTLTNDGGHPRARASFWPVTCHNNYDPHFAYARRDAFGDDSVVMLGGRDGYVRQFAADQADDDGTNFTVYLEYGPILVGSQGGLTDGAVQKIIGILDESSSAVKWTLRAGKTAEAAFNQSDAGQQRTDNWDAAGLNPTHYPRLRGPFVVLKVEPKTAGTRIALETVHMILEELGERKVAS